VTAAAGGGVTAATGGCVNAAGSGGLDAGPDGGARLMAGADGASGTDAGGTGGGRSLNSCAATGVAHASIHRHARTHAHAAPALAFPLLPPKNVIENIIGLLFDLKRGEFKPQG
jgi:hypothetical protein